jgi:hypothetical protein
MIPLALELLVLALVLGALGSVAVYSLITGIGPMPSSARARRVILGLLPAGLEGRVVELGAGFGTLAFPLADALPRAEVLAIERSPLPFLVLCLRQRLRPRANLVLLWRDFHRVPLDGAAAAVCYLYPGGMRRLRPKLERELAPGTPVVSNAFAVPGWRPEATLALGDLFAGQVHLYRVPPATAERAAAGPAHPADPAAPGLS